MRAVAYDENILWTVNKIHDYLMNTSPYREKFISKEIIDKPTLIYEDFIILVEDEYNIIIGIQPTMNKKESDLLIQNLEMIVDNVIIREL